MKYDFEITDSLLSKFLAGEASPEEAMMAEDWAAKSDINQAYLDSCCRIFELPDTASLSLNNQTSWEKIVQGIEKKEKLKRIKSIAWSMGIAASAILLVIIGILINHSPENTHDIKYYAKNDALAFRLKDATEITVSPNSVLTVDKDFGRSNRKVTLSGSASFSVTHNEDIPFLVDISGFFVQDIGTKFTISSSANSDTIHVSVREGKVSTYDNFGSKFIVNAHEKTFYIKSARKLAVPENDGSAIKPTSPVNPLPRKTIDSVINNPPSPALTVPPVLLADKPARLLSTPDTSLANTLSSVCDCDDTPPFKRFEKLDINALSQAEYNQPDLLVNALGSDNPERRAMAVRRLGKLQSDKYLGDILAMMSDKDCIVRMEVVNALTNFQNDNIGKTLLSDIHDPACFVREEIAGELKKYYALDGVESALITLSEDNSSNVAAQALNSLKYYGDDNLGKELLSHLHDQDEQTKVAAIYSLKNFRADSIGILLTAELNDPNKHIRQATAEVLKYYNPKISRPALLNLLKTDTTEHVQLAIIESLTVVGDDSVIDPLIAFVNDKRSVIRQLTIRALGVIGNKKVIPYLQAASGDKNSFVRKEADDALKKLTKN